MPKEPGTRSPFDLSHLLEAQLLSTVQHPSTGLPPVARGQVHRPTAELQRVLPEHPKPPATVIHDIKEKHDRYNVSFKVKG